MEGEEERGDGHGELREKAAIYLKAPQPLQLSLILELTMGVIHPNEFYEGHFQIILPIHVGFQIK